MSVSHAAAQPTLIPDNGLLRVTARAPAPAPSAVDAQAAGVPDPDRLARGIELAFVSATIALFAGLAGAAAYTLTLALTI